jgi:hypothetical protein
VSADSGVRFWCDYAEREGGAWEGQGERTLVVLPPALARDFGLPEECSVTSDPAVAEDGGALLFLPGHPALQRAAAAVLERGDAGYGFLPWPRTRMPDGALLLARARECLAVEHGRLDLAGDPAPVHLPVLRAVVLVAYAADQQFQELEEAWADARTGAALPPEACRRLAAVPPAAGPDGPTGAAALVLRPDLVRALGGMLRGFTARAEARAAALAREAAVPLRAEADRAEAYYAEVLDGLARRHAGAPPDRQRVLEAQAEATRAERARRLGEIADKARVRHELRPVRLHLLLAPALHLPLSVRRGARAYPFDLVWLLGAGGFAPVLCPACGSAAPLVAGREALGCRDCL